MTDVPSSTTGKTDKDDRSFGCDQNDDTTTGGDVVVVDTRGALCCEGKGRWSWSRVADRLGECGVRRFPCVPKVLHPCPPHCASQT
jgi:hypothetical protein